MLNAKAKSSLCTNAKESALVSSLRLSILQSKRFLCVRERLWWKFFLNNPVCCITKSLLNVSAIPMP